MPQEVTIDVGTPLITRPNLLDYNDGIYKPAAIDENSRATIVMDSTIDSVHVGEVFGWMQFFTLGIGDADFCIVTPASKRIVLQVQVGTTLEPAEMYLYEGSTFGAGGTALTLIDLNRETANSATTTVVRDQTVSVDGTLLASIGLGDSGQGNARIGGGASEQIILANSTNYTLRVTSASASNRMNLFIAFIERAERTV